MLRLHFCQQDPVRRMAELACAAQKDGRSVLIVPEQLSHEAERTLCSVGGARSSRVAEVLSFTRLAGRVFAVEGGAARKRLDGAGRLLAMSLAAEQLRPKIKFFAAPLARPEFLEELLQTVDELKSCCISAEQLFACARSQTGQTAQKLEELGMLLEAYDAVCARTAYDPRDQLTELAQRLECGSFAAGRVFYLAGFQDFTAQELRVLQALLSGGAEVTALLCCDDLEHGAGCFAAARRTGRQLRRMAQLHGVPVRVEQTQPQFFPELAFLLGGLSGGRAEQFPAAAEHLTLSSVQTAQEECREAVEQIWRAVLDGARYREIGVAVASGELETALCQLLSARGLPFYSTGRTDACVRPLFALVLSSLEAVSYGFRCEQVTAVLRTGLTRLTEDEVDELEDYACAWNIRGGRWFRPWTEHPDGYGAVMDEAARQRLQRLNDLRARAAGPLQELDQALRTARNVAEQVRALFRYLDALQVSGTLRALTTQLRAEGYEQLAQEQAQLYAMLVGAMEQLHALGELTAQQPEGFYRTVRLLLAQCKVAAIPATLDALTVGTLEELRCRPFRMLLVLGAAEGSFPAFQKQQSLISEEERTLLRESGASLPSIEEQLDRGSLSIFSLLASAQQTLFISCSAEDGQPSHLFRRFCAQFPDVVQGAAAGRLSDFWSLEAAGARAAASGLPQALPDALRAPLQQAQEHFRARAEYAPGALTGTAVQSLYGPVLRLSPSRIDRLASCRCGYFLEYGLHLRERQVFSFDAPVFGTFVHEILEKTVREAELLGGMRAVTDAQLREMAERHIAAFTAERLDGLEGKQARLRFLYRRNCAEALQILQSLAQELRCSDFRPRAFELRFGPGGERPAIPIPDASGPAEITGIVDRADLCSLDGRQWLRIVDYKTGRKELDYTDLSIGIGMQMLIYLFALEKTGLPGTDGQLCPAGVLYFPAREPVLSAQRRLSADEAALLHRKEARRSGLVTDEEQLLEAMEHCDGKPEFLPYQTSKSGRKGDLASLEDWSLLQRHVERQLAALADSVRAGEIAANPYTRGPQHGACTWCRYAAVCRFRASGGVSRSYQKLSAQEFWTQLRKEEDHG